MPITKQVVFSQVTATEGHIIQIQLKKQVVEDGKVLSFGYHRTSLEPGVPLGSQIADPNANLAQAREGSWPAIGAADVERIQAVVDSEHTPAVIAVYRAKVAAARLA